jgi:dTDP-4-amino-4,6-dideoxygalactose transaminase
VSYHVGLCPNAEQSLRELCTLGLHERWTDREIEDCAAAIDKVARACVGGAR